MVRRGHPTIRKGMTLKALSLVPHALVDVSGMGHDGLRSAFKRRKIPIDIRLYFSQFMVLPSLLQKSDMVVIAPASLVDAVSKLVRVQVMDLPFKLPAFEIGCTGTSATTGSGQSLAARRVRGPLCRLGWLGNVAQVDEVSRCHRPIERPQRALQRDRLLEAGGSDRHANS